MLLLSEILLSNGAEITTFEELKSNVQHMALIRSELFFNVDIEPPMYSDRPNDWHEHLNLAFESAR